MKARAKLLVLFMLFFTTSKAQNLIINGSFETQTNCCGYVDYAPPWELASALPAKLYDSSSAFNPYFDVPVNLDSSFGFQIPKTGHAYSSFNVYWSDTIYREYLGYPLTQDLISGKSYCLKFFVNLVNYSHYGVDGIGAYFSNGPIYCPTQYCLLNYSPQVSNPNGNIILDTLAWTEISGCFTANGSERYMTIGNFKSDSLTQRAINRQVSGSNWSTVYYIDDVSLMEDTTFGVTETHEETELLISPNPAQNTIQVLTNNNKELVEIRIFNSVGKLVFEKQNLSENKILDVSEFPSGVYYCKILLNSGKSFSQK